MRDLLNRSDLSRYAGQFVWLEMNYDTPANNSFLAKYRVSGTPTFVMIDPRSEEVLELQPGAMSLTEVTQFLERGAARMPGGAENAADRALKQGDRERATNLKGAISAYQHALQLAPKDWTDRELAESSLVKALQADDQDQLCAQTAITDAQHMARNSMFARTVMDGLWCVAGGESAEWVPGALHALEPMANEALGLSTTVRDHRDGLYRALMLVAVNQHNEAVAAKWGDQWLRELDAIKPATNEERSAVDISRVENIQVYGDASRIIPALLDSERAMPKDYVASLRLAEAEEMAKRYADALVAIDHGLARNPGAFGRSWLLQMKAEVLTEDGKPEQSRQALELALKAAKQIPSPRSRDQNVARIRKALSVSAEAGQK